MESILDQVFRLLQEISGLFGSADSFMGSVDSVMGSLDSIMGSGAYMVAAMVFFVTLILAAINFVLDVIAYLFRTICLYKLAKNAGRTDGWLAFIPIAWHYVLCDLSEEPFVLFGRQWFKNRTNAFWVWLLIKYLGSLIIGLIAGTVCSLLMMVPVIGTVLSGLVGALLPFVPAFLSAAIRYRFLFDAAEVFRPGRNNKTLALLSVLVELLLSTDLMTVLLLWSMVKARPVRKTAAS